MGVTSSYDPARNASSLAGFVRRHDPDRFLTALFAPPAKREALFALYAFNHELARARETVSEAPLALIRLQWWREVVEGAHRRHEVAEPLSAAIDAGALRRDDLLGVIDAREVEAEPAIETSREWHAYLHASAGGLAVAAARLLGARTPSSFDRTGQHLGLPACCATWERTRDRVAACCRPTRSQHVSCRQIRSSPIPRKRSV